MLIVVALVVAATVVVIGQGGYASWLSINMTGVDSSHIVVERQGVADSHLVMETSYVPVALFPPTSLVLTMVSDNEVYIDWAMGSGACYSMVRGAVGRVPEDRTDGYLVYYGSATNTTDWVDLNVQHVYYRVWSQACSEAWEDEGISDSIGGVNLRQIIFLILALVPTIGMFALKSGRKILGFIAAGGWLLLGIYSYTQSAEAWDIDYGLFWLSMAAVLACALVPSLLKEQKEEEPEPDDGLDESDRALKRDIDNTRNERKGFRSIFKGR